MIDTAPISTAQFVTLTLGDQLFGVPVLDVRDVLRAQAITRIPLASPEIAGSLNLRGRIVTVIDLRRRLNLPRAATGPSQMSVVIEREGDLYALLVDQVSEVLTLESSQFERNPLTLTPRPRAVLRWAVPTGDVTHARFGLGSGADPGVGSMSEDMPLCLVVDDSRVVRKVARRILEQHGFRVEEAENGLEGLVACQRSLPRCVLLDWNMPVMNGLGLLKALADGIRAG